MIYDIHDKHFIRKVNGGYSPCIPGNDAYGLRPFTGSVLPNCVGHAVAAYNIHAGESKSCKYLGNVNAKEFVKFIQTQNLPHGDTPKVGACMVWGGSDDGHVASVEEVIDNDTVSTSESGWNYRAAPVIRYMTRKRGNGNWGQNYEFLTFIYQPGTTPDPPAPKPVYYTIKRGDTLSGIAKQFNTTVAELVKLNNITNPNYIIAGDVILISGDPETPIIYRVKIGDTLTKIARKFDTTVNIIVSDNNIKNKNLIFVGEKLKVYRGKK